jgi:hypothetical protein
MFSQGGPTTCGRVPEAHDASHSVVNFDAALNSVCTRTERHLVASRRGQSGGATRSLAGPPCLASMKNVFSQWDGWIRRRIRIYLWKQWRLPRTRIRNLLRLGVSLDQAITHGVSRKGDCRLSKTLGGHAGMTKQWLRDQGLVFLRYLWGDLAPLRRTA